MEDKQKKKHLSQVSCANVLSRYNDRTHIKHQLASLHAACSGGIILERFGKTVEGLELLVILLVFDLIGGKYPIYAFAVHVRLCNKKTANSG